MSHTVTVTLTTEPHRTFGELHSVTTHTAHGVQTRRIARLTDVNLPNEALRAAVRSRPARMRVRCLPLGNPTLKSLPRGVVATEYRFAIAA